MGVAPTSTSSPSSGEAVRWASDGDPIHGWLVRPDRAEPPAPCVILLHEWWGLADHVKTVAQRFAREGYVALAPDLYSRLGSKVAQDPREATALMNAVSAQAILRDLNAATQYLKAQPFVDPWRIGVVGFSMGGTFALTQATHNSDLKAAVVWYGKVPPIESLDALLCPVLYHYAAKDTWVTKQEVDRLSQGLAQFGKPGEVVTYAECSHGFFNETQPDVYRSAEAEDAWRRTLRWLATYMR